MVRFGLRHKGKKGETSKEHLPTSLNCERKTAQDDKSQKDEKHRILEPEGKAHSPKALSANANAICDVEKTRC